MPCALRFIIDHYYSLRLRSLAENSVFLQLSDSFCKQRSSGALHDKRRMSRLADYSKFDNLDEGSDDEDVKPQRKDGCPPPGTEPGPAR